MIDLVVGVPGSGSNRNKCCIEISYIVDCYSDLDKSNRNKCCIEILSKDLEIGKVRGSNRNKCCIEIE